MDWLVNSVNVDGYVRIFTTRLKSGEKEGEFHQVVYVVDFYPDQPPKEES